MRSFYLVTVLLLPACGAVDNAAPNSANDATKDVAEQGQAASPDTKLQSALLVQDAAALPACDVEHEGLLVYVKADAGFQACASGAWAAIDLKGKDGSVGKDGKDGAKGDDGIDSSSTVWLDVQTKRRWVAAVATDRAGAEAACSASFEYPSCDDLLAAANHGLYNGLSQHTNAWCGADTGNNNVPYVVINSMPLISNQLKTNVIGVYCVEAAD